MDINKSYVFHRRLDYDYPVITHGEGIYLFDEGGKKYIDAVGGAMVAILGHGQKIIASRISEYAMKFSYLHGSQFTTKHIEEYAYQLVKLAPPSLNKVLFVSGGSEATETAIKLARQYCIDSSGKTSKYKIIHRWPSYHGNTLGALSLTGKASAREIYKPLLIPFPYVPAPICYRCPYGRTSNMCNLECAYALGEKILQENPNTVAAFIAEPVIGTSAGVVPPPEGYFSVIRSICDKYDILLILDEIMCGFGRTGKWFASQHWNVNADILYIGKGISAGFVPLAAVFCSNKIINAIKRDCGNFIHGYTYVNNPLTTAVGKLVLEYIIDNDLLKNVVEQGTYLFSRLKEFYQFDIVGDVRGLGLLYAIELVKDKSTKQPFPRNSHLSERILQTAMKKGLSLYFAIGFCEDGRGDAIMVGPPYTVTKKEIDEIIEIFFETISEIQSSI
ncbi:MAG: aminotransferase class III-fold pyridoxal phosphate-dependent enzyme [Candidatus Atribacteria bacterium]